MSVNYHKKIQWIFQQFPAFQKVGNSAYKPTLENTRKIIELLEIPVHKMNFIHVAGTNGKGTTCSIIASALTEAGKKTGLFTSPHIKDFRERIRINGVEISEKRVIEYISFIQKTKLDFSPSFFELTWGLALLYFYEEKCEEIVVETGLGGRLDATNVIFPKISVITNIALDHIEILGTTRREIANEKAGIIKQNTPVVVGENDHEIALVFENKAKEKNAPLFILEEKQTENVFEKNKQLAFKVLDIILSNFADLEEIKQKAIENIYKNTGLYGRNQLISENPPIIVDAAHNKKGVEEFIRTIRENYPHKNIYALYGASKDKEVSEIVKLFPKEWKWFFTEFKSERSTKIIDFYPIANKEGLKFRYFSDAVVAYISIKEQIIENQSDMIVVFGSFYLISEII